MNGPKMNSSKRHYLMNIFFNMLPCAQRATGRLNFSFPVINFSEYQSITNGSVEDSVPYLVMRECVELLEDKFATHSVPEVIKGS